MPSIFQLGAENNIEKSRCLAHLRKKIFIVDAIRPGFSGFRASEARIRLARSTDSPRSEMLRSL
jgi:hypothetical protein